MGAQRAISRCTLARVLFGALLGAFVAIVPAAHGQCQYEVTIIYGPPCPPPLSGLAVTVATGINELGRVVGYWEHCGGSGSSEAFRWTEGHGFVTLPRPAGVVRAWGWDINDDGVIVGTYDRTGVGFRAFVYQGGIFTELAPEPPGLWSQATALNNAGQAVGYRSIRDGVTPYNAFIWSAVDGFIDLGVMNGPVSVATAINDVGVAVGWTGNQVLTSEAFIWQDGEVELLGPVPDGFMSEAWAISNNGIVVGSGRIPMEGAPLGAPRAFVWQDGQFTMLGTLPDHAWSRAHGISPDGWQIVGRSWNVDGDPNIAHAFIWQDGAMADLNELIRSDVDIVVTGAGAINTSGWISGAGRIFSSVVGVVLKPIDIPIGDIDRDCHVGVPDLVILIDHFGETGLSPGDVNRDGVVNVLDLILLLLNFAP